MTTNKKLSKVRPIKAGPTHHASDNLIFVSVEALREDVAAVLADYFAASNATGLVLRQHEIDWLAGGIVQRVKQRHQR